MTSGFFSSHPSGMFLALSTWLALKNTPQLSWNACVTKSLALQDSSVKTHKMRRIMSSKKIAVNCSPPYSASQHDEDSPGHPERKTTALVLRYRGVGLDMPSRFIPRRNFNRFGVCCCMVDITGVSCVEDAAQTIPRYVQPQ